MLQNRPERIWDHHNTGPIQLLANTRIGLGSTSDAPDAVSVYRKILQNQPDNSVTIVTVGFLTNLGNLLKSQPDSISDLPGDELVRKKVTKLVSMAGWFPEGREFNVFIDSASSKYVFENWPGEIIFTGFEIGKNIFTGLRLIQSPALNSPVKDVFRISIPLSEEDRNGRMSWDETAVLDRCLRDRRIFRYKERHNNCIIPMAATAGRTIRKGNINMLFKRWPSRK